MRTSKFVTRGFSAILLATALTPAIAQDEAGPPEAITITGGATVVSDYRFRGFTQNSENAAVQGTINLNHESGLYAGVFGSSVSFAGNTEIDLYAGYTKELASGITVDAGLLYYLYPKKGGGPTDFFEPYVNLTTAIGPASLKVGANYAWKQSAITDALGNNASAIYLHAEPSIGVPGTPFTLNGHIGWAKSDSFLGGPDGEVFDYSVGASASYKALTFSVNYVNTDVSTVLGKEALGADGAVVFSVGASF